MRRTTLILLTTALAVGSLAVEGEDLTDHPCYDAEAEQLAYPEQQVYFHEGDSKVGNAAAPAPWDTTAPSTSVTGGAGAGTLTPGTATLGEGTPAEEYAEFTGTFEGCIDTMLLDIYSFDLSNRTGHGGVTGAPDCLPDCVPSGQPATMDIGLTITIDGNDVYTGGPIEITSDFTNEGFGPNRNRVAINLAETMELYADYGALTLDGAHEITVRVRNWYVNTGHSVFVWDTSEVPSGLVFNGEVPEEVATVG